MSDDLHIACNSLYISYCSERCHRAGRCGSSNMSYAPTSTFNSGTEAELKTREDWSEIIFGTPQRRAQGIDKIMNRETLAVLSKYRENRRESTKVLSPRYVGRTAESGVALGRTTRHRASSFENKWPCALKVKPYNLSITIVLVIIIIFRRPFRRHVFEDVSGETLTLEKKCCNTMLQLSFLPLSFIPLSFLRW